MEASETAESIHLSDDTEEAIHLSDTEEAIHLSDTKDNETDEPIDLEVSWEDVLDYRKLTVEDVMAKTFKTLEEAEKFYYSYALAIGFGPRRDTRGGLFEGKLRRRQWVCNKQGYRDKKWLDRETDGSGRNRRKLTRQGCMAKFRVNYMVDEGYYAVRAFDEDHSHQCANPRQAAFILSHRNVDEAALGNTNTMTKVSIRPCHAFEYMVEQSGGYITVGFTRKDLYNKLDQQRRTTPFESDSEGALSYMSALAAKDPHFYCRFSVDDEDRLVNIFWRDGNSYVDYMCWGDVLVFDSTYNTNVYGRPLVLFVGSNNHRGSILFGVGILGDETADTYTWLLSTFLDSMKGKKPTAVITDGVESMHIAIGRVMPEARHRLCSWHFSRNAHTNLNSKDAEKAFNGCMNKFQTVQHFEEMWEVMLQEFELRNHFWTTWMYGRRQLWAQAFFGDVHMTGMRSTQRSESMNNFVKDTLGAGKKKMVDIVPQMDRAHMRLRNNQVRDDFNTMNSFPVIETHLEDLEGHAASTYTYDVYKWVKKEIMKEKFLVTKGFQAAAEDDHSVHKMANFKWQQYVHEVVYYHGRLTIDEEALEEAVLPPIMVCTCNMFQYKGVPCRHMFMLMKQENMSKIPRSLIMKRWTRNAGSVCDIECPDGQNMDKEALEVSRFGALTGDCNRMCSYASKTTKGYSMLKKEIARLTALMEGLVKDSEQVHVCDPQPERTGCVIRDPVVVKKKGNQNQETGRRPITCSYCKGAGHNIQSCGERKEKEREAAAQQSVGEDNPPSVSTPAKKVYLCGKCNGPGHTARSCKNAPAPSNSE